MSKQRSGLPSEHAAATARRRGMSGERKRDYVGGTVHAAISQSNSKSTASKPRRVAAVSAPRKAAPAATRSAAATRTPRPRLAAPSAPATRSRKAPAVKPPQLRAAPITRPVKALSEPLKRAPVASRPAASGKVHSIEIAKIHTGLNPREHFDQAEIYGLAQSIRKNKLLQPVTVRPHKGGYQLIAGERRLRAHQMLGWTHIDAIIKPVSDAEAANLALVENIQRQDMTPSETGRAYRKLVNGGQSVAQLQEQFGKSREHYTAHLALVDTLEPHLQRLVDKRELAFSLVQPLADLNPKSREEAAERIMSKRLGVGPARAMIRQIAARDAQISMFDTPKPTKASIDAREKYRTAMEDFTKVLAGFDDETMERLAPTLSRPLAEHERLGLMRKQLGRMQATIEGSAMRREISRPSGPRRA